MGRCGWKDIADAEFPAGASTPRIMDKSADGILRAYGEDVPADGVSGYAIGCIFQHTDAGSVEEMLYVNEGTATSCDFNVLRTDTYKVNADAAGDRGPSPLIWESCPVLEYLINPAKGFYFFDDFTHTFNLAAGAGSAGQLGNWSYYGDNDAEAEAIIQTDDSKGELKIVDGGAGADNNAMFICLGPNTGGYIKLDSDTKKAFWFEARIKAELITDAQNGIFCGFMEEALLGSDTIIADGGTMADKDYVGFWRLEGDGDKLDVIHNVSTGGHTVLSADAVTLVADTYVKVGMKLDAGDATLKFYADGVYLCSVELDAANFPDAEELCFYFGCKAGENADNSASIDWVRIAQDY